MVNPRELLGRGPIVVGGRDGLDTAAPPTRRRAINPSGSLRSRDGATLAGARQAIAFAFLALLVRPFGIDLKICRVCEPR